MRGTFTDAFAAAAALRSAQAQAITGAIAFDVTDRCALVAPQHLHISSTPIPPGPIAAHTITSVANSPDEATHRARVNETVSRIRSGALAKVVLARTVDLDVTPAVDIDALVGAFAAGNAEHNVFAVDLVAAQGPDAGTLVGASPEALVRKRGREVTCLPYAGSAARSADPRVDAEAARSLAASDKDRLEHAFVVDYLRERLDPLCDELSVPPEPEVRATGEIWHLATPIRGILRDPATTALDLALQLSPTPAVCGTPSDAAAALIKEIEGPRGLYGGAVGWSDAVGDGEWMVTIRALHIADDRRSLRTWAGGGIVAQSDPQAEVDETTAKLRTVLNALGVPGPQ